MKKKKSKFWLFVFSFWPGAGHMYLGFMKMGVSLMVGFLLSIAVVDITGIGALAVFPITLYIYSFFHANNIGGLDDEQFAAMEDVYLFGLDGIDYDRFRLERKSRKILAVAFIVLGVCMLWNVGFGMLWDYMGRDNPIMKAVYYLMRDDIPRLVIAIAVIWFGIVLLRGKKIAIEEKTPGEQGKQTEEPLQIEQKEE